MAGSPSCPSDRWALGGEARIGWWLVDPATGDTVDMLEDGRGQTMVEWAILVTVWSGVLVELAYCLKSDPSAKEWRAFMDEMKAAGTQLGVR